MLSRASAGDSRRLCDASGPFKSHPCIQKRKQSIWTAFSFLERCVPQAERDVHFVRDVAFGSDVRCGAWEGTHHITLRRRRNTSLCVSTTSLAHKGKHHSLQTPKFML